MSPRGTLDWRAPTQIEATIASTSRYTGSKFRSSDRQWWTKTKISFNRRSRNTNPTSRINLLLKTHKRRGSSGTSVDRLFRVTAQRTPEGHRSARAIKIKLNHPTGGSTWPIKRTIRIKNNTGPRSSPTSRTPSMRVRNLKQSPRWSGKESKPQGLSTWTHQIILSFSQKDMRCISSKERI